MVRWFVEQEKIGLHHQKPRQMRAHDPTAAHGARRTIEIALAKCETSQDTFGFRLELPAAVFVEDVQGGVITFFVTANTRFVALDQLLRLHQLGRARHRQFEHGLVARGRSFLWEKTDRGFFLDRHGTGVRRRLTENQGKQRRLSRAIGTDKSDAIAAIYLKRHVFKENSSGERFAEL